MNHHFVDGNESVDKSESVLDLIRDRLVGVTMSTTEDEAVQLPQERGRGNTTDATKTGGAAGSELVSYEDARDGKGDYSHNGKIERQSDRELSIVVKQDLEQGADPADFAKTQIATTRTVVPNARRASTSVPNNYPPSRSLPGAYAEAPPSSDLEGRTNPPRCRMSEASAAVSSTLEVTSATDDLSNNTAGLVEATQVQPMQDVVVGYAQSVDTVIDSTTANREEEKRQCQLIMQGTIALLLLFMCLAIALALWRSKTKANYEQSSFAPLPGTPTAAPSSAPTSALADLLMNLPTYTLESLEDCTAPQSQARDWLAQHQDIEILPLWRQIQLFALGTFYYAFDGPRWPLGLDSDWMDDTRSECYWYSGLFGTFLEGDGTTYDQSDSQEVSACNDKGEFEVIYLTMASLLGFSISSPQMPREIGLLTSLKRLELGRNGATNLSLANVWPQEVFYQLTNLERLRIMTEDFFPSTLPTEIGRLTNLKDLGIWQAELTGPIPTEIGLLTQLTWLGLHKNQLSGPLPSELCNLSTNLEGFSLSSNDLSGTIPSELSMISGLQLLELDGNSLEGPIPSELGLLDHLQVLRLNSNSLTGSIPVELGDDSSNADAAAASGGGRFISMGENPGLSGTVPPSLCALNGHVVPPFEFSLHVGVFPSQISCGFEFDCSEELCGCDGDYAESSACPCP